MKRKKKAFYVGMVLLLWGAVRSPRETVWAKTIRQTQLLDQKQGEEFVSPPEEYRDSLGNVYDLAEWELTKIPGETQWREIEREVVYRKVEAADQIPSAIPFAQKAEEEEIKGELIEADREIIGEEWSADFQVPLTFHAYGAAAYTLGNLTLEIQEEFPPPEEYGGQLLSLLGLPEDDYEVCSMEWRGEAYQDESGQLCRDAVAVGNKRLRDYRVIYRGEVAWPAPEIYELETLYRIREASQVELGERAGKEGEADLAQREPVKQDFWLLVRKGAALTIAVGLLGIAIGLIILGLYKWKKLKKTS